MASASEIMYNNQSGSLVSSGTDVTNSSSASVINFATAPDFATIVSPNYIKLGLNPGTSTYEIVYLTAYTSGATTGTVTRSSEDSTNWPAVAHPNGTWVCTPTVETFANSAFGYYNVKNYGATGNGIAVYGSGSINAMSHTLSVSGASFTSADVGKCISVIGAGASVAALVTTITGYNSSTSVTLSSAASTSVTTAAVTYGTNDQSAIQSAINAAFNAGGGVVFFPGPSIYCLGGTYSTIPGFSGDTSQGLLYIPFNAQSNVEVSIEMRGMVAGVLPLPEGGTEAGPSSGVVLYNMSTQSPSISSTPYPFVLTAGLGGSGNINLVAIAIHDLIIRQVPSYVASNTVNGLSVGAVPEYDLNIRVDVDAVVSGGAPSTAPFPDPNTQRSAYGVLTSAANTNGGNGRGNMAVIGYAVGFNIAGQAQGLKLYASHCTYPVQLLANGELHPCLIESLGTNNCPHIFTTVGGGGIYLVCLSCDIQGNTNSVWMETQDNLVGNGAISGIVNAAINNQTDDYFIISGDPGTLEIRPIDGSELIVTLNETTPPNPLTSASVYKNTTGSPIIVTVMCYPTTPGATNAGIVYALGTTSSPVTQVAQLVAPAATSSLPDVLEFRVPPGRYFSVTAFSTTIGSAYTIQTAYQQAT